MKRLGLFPIGEEPPTFISDPLPVLEKFRAK
jgi:hypothetical protein